MIINYYFFLVLRLEPKTLHMLKKHMLHHWATPPNYFKVFYGILFLFLKAVAFIFYSYILKYF